jgi:hypothetical protein
MPRDEYIVAIATEGRLFQAITPPSPPPFFAEDSRH